MPPTGDVALYRSTGMHGRKVHNCDALIRGWIDVSRNPADTTA